MQIENTERSKSIDYFKQAVDALPLLPKTIQYEDDYDEVVRSLKDSETTKFLPLFVNGSLVKLDWSVFHLRVRPLLRVFLILSLQTHSPATVKFRFYQLCAISAEDLERAASSTATDLRDAWPEFCTKYSTHTLKGLRSLLQFLCSVRFMAWSAYYREFVIRALHLRANTGSGALNGGESILEITEEVQLVRWIDQMAKNTPHLQLAEIQVACLLISSYQFGMRPKQLGTIRRRDCRVRTSVVDKSDIVHLTFRIIKQRDNALSKLPLVRKVKREWAPLYVRLMTLTSEQDADSFLFGFRSSNEIGQAISEKLSMILPSSESRVAYDLRDALAQRMVDAGASHEELAEAMGHTSLASGLKYFHASANQSELVNKALGLSDVYQTVISVAKIKFISPDDLARLKGVQQIAGVPHGIPIVGIGKCKTGQPSCPYNPVMSCYGCEKFLPLQDLGTHLTVLAELRTVVNDFDTASKSEMKSPAFLQLQRTISEVQTVINAPEFYDNE